MPTAKPRVLVIAEQCNPEWVSIPLEGWSHYRAIARQVDAHLVSQVRNRDAIVRAGLVQDVDFTAIDSERVAKRMNDIASKVRGGAGRGYTTSAVFTAVSFAYFDRLVAKQFTQPLREGKFDLVHQITPLSPAQPPRLAKMCRKVGVPFVWGPINGGLAWPPGYGKVLRQEREWLAPFRAAYKLMPGYASSRRAAAAIVAGSADAHMQLGARYHDKAVYIAENGVDPERFAVERTRTPALPIRIVFIGRMVPYKGGDMLIDAAEPMLRAGTVTIDFIGDGPQKPELEASVASRSLPGVTFVGRVDHTELAARVATYDVFGFPSIREFGGAVAIEAMALGVVPIVPNYGGLGDLVSEGTGYRVPIGERDAIVASYREVLQRIVANPGELIEKSARGRERVARHFTWDRKAEQMTKVYDWVLGRGPKPQFPMPTPDDPT